MNQKPVAFRWYDIQQKKWIYFDENSPHPRDSEPLYAKPVDDESVKNDTR